MRLTRSGTEVHGSEEVGAQITVEEARLLQERLADLLSVGMLDPDVDIGLVELEPGPQSALLEPGTGACTNAVSLAVTAEQFERRVAAHFAAPGIRVVGFTDVETLAARRRVLREALAAAERPVDPEAEDSA